MSETPVKQAVLGERFSPEEVPAEECYAYFGPYGTPPDSMEDIYHLSEKGPMYPTRSVLRVRLAEADDEYRIVAAKRIDTSDPAFSDDWATIES